MYERFYGLTEKPFNVTPDPRFLYLSRHHREALAHLQYAVQEHKGFVAIIGEVGTGKTTLVHALLNRLTHKAKTAFIFSTSLTAKGLLKMMVADFGVDTKSQTKTELLLDLNQFLLQQYTAGIDSLLIVDEAQNLSLSLLEEIRMLSNLETDRDKLLQIILVGQPELGTKLAMPELRQLRQRIGCRYRIYPLDPKETTEYIQHRLGVAGLSEGSLFDRQAVERIYRWSGGTPRLINMICDSTLLLGYTCGKRKIETSLVEETIADLEALGIVSTASSEPQQPAKIEDQGAAGGIPWRQRIFRPFTAASGLLLGAALFSLPLITSGSGGVSPSSSANFGAQSAPDRDPIQDWDARHAQEAALSAGLFEPSEGDSHVRAMDEQEGVLFSVHVASFRELDRARSLARSLRERGHEIVFIVPPQLPESGGWHRVMLGHYGDWESARRAAQNYLLSGAFPYAQPQPLEPQDENDWEE